MNRTTRRLACWTVVIVGVAMLGAQPAPAAKKVLRLVLDGPLMEAPPGDLFIGLGGEKPKTLHGLVKTIERAGKEADIAGIALIIESPEMSLAQAEEVTRTLKDFRSQGKKVYCYLDEAGNLAYMLACAADRITLAENSELAIVGINARMMFFKGLLDKIGVQAEMLHCGAYKSALEPFTRTEPSKEAAENVNWLLDGIFDRWVQLIADGRKLSVEDVKKAVDSAPILAEQALKLKLVDEVSSFPAFAQMIHKEFGQDVDVLKRLDKKEELKVDFDNPFAIFSLFGKLMEKADEKPKAGLGLIYIDGGIVTGKSEQSLFGGSGGTAGSTTLRAAFEKARKDDQVKAVVVRVDSPGGSALASDIIWKAATACKKAKPVIVSMGGVAGSGGYYVSIPGDVIFAEDTTITGSIGVVGGKFVWKDLMQDKLGITSTEFSRGARAGLMSPNHPWTDDQRGWIQGYMDAVYKGFKDRVKESRGDRIKGDLEKLAGGRVYTGKQALEHGLIDKIGGLSDALAYAAKKVDLPEDYELYVLPKPMDIVEVFKKLLGQESEDEWEIQTAASVGSGLAGAGAATAELCQSPSGSAWAGALANLSSMGLMSRMGLASDPLFQAALPLLKQAAPDQVGDMVKYLRNAAVLNREHVGCFMPFVSSPR